MDITRNFITDYIFCFHRIQAIDTLIQVHVHNVVFTLKIGLCLYKITCYLHFNTIFHPYKIIFLLFLYFPRYNNVYPTPLHIIRAIKRWLPMKSQTLSFETIVNELDFLKKAVIIQGNARKKRFNFGR